MSRQMSMEKRVLGRLGAHELSPAEIELVTGGKKPPEQRTMTVCTITIGGNLDGDVVMGEC